MLLNMIRNVWGKKSDPLNAMASIPELLCIGDPSEGQKVPFQYATWKIRIIRPKSDKNVHKSPAIFDTRRLHQNTCDVIYLARRVNDLSRPELLNFLDKIKNLLKLGGYLHLSGIDSREYIKKMAITNADLTDTAYISAVGPITYQDVLWGYHRRVSESKDREGYQRAKTSCGYSRNSLHQILSEAGYNEIHFLETNDPLLMELVATKSQLDSASKIMLGIAKA